MRFAANRRLTEVDFAPGMLSSARRRVSEARLVRADAHRLPFAGGAIDLVWCSYRLDLLPTADLTPVLREFFFGSCRPIRLAPFVEKAGFIAVGCEDLPDVMRSEVVTVRRPSIPGAGPNGILQGA